MKCRTLAGAAIAAKLSLAFGVAVLAARPAEAEGLPAYYTAVDCLISHGTEYINTEYTPTKNCRIVLDFAYATDTDKGGTVLGFGASANAQSIRLFREKDASTGVVSYRVNFDDYYPDLCFINHGESFDTDRHVFDVSNDSKTLDGLEIDGVYYEPGKPTDNKILLTKTLEGPLYLFAADQGWKPIGAATALATCKIYSCQIYDGTTLVRDFVPCLNASGEPVLYDLVGQKDYANKGEGAFEYVAGGLIVEATLTGVNAYVDGASYGPTLTVTDPAEGYQVEWSADGGAYGAERPTFTEPGEYTVRCRVSADGYMTRILSAVVKIGDVFTLAGNDPSGSSSMNASGSPKGWTDTSGVTKQKHNPSAGNAYVVDRNYVLRSPNSSSFTFGGDTLTLSGGAKILDKSSDKGLLTIPRLIIAGNAQITHGDGNHLKKIAGAIEIREGGALKIDASYDNTPDKPRPFEIQSSVSGAGSLWAGASMDGTTGSPFIDFTGSFADFTGRLDVFAGARMRLEVIFSSSLPGDPSEVMADGLTMAGKSALVFKTSGELGFARGVTFGSGTREIFVDEGQTVQIDGRLTGTAGFTKTGLGTLVLASVSPELSGTVTVAEGTLQLCGEAATVLPNATVGVASGAVLDETGTPCEHDPVVEATLTGFDAYADGRTYSPALTVAEPAEGCQVEWSLDDATFTEECPAFTEVGEYTVTCRVSIDGYMTRRLRTTVTLRRVRRVVATEAEATGVWANATVAGDDAWAAIQGVIDVCDAGDGIFVKPGTYDLTNVLTFASSRPSGIMIRSDDGEGNLAPETTIFDGGYPARTNRLFSVNSANVTLRGLTIRDGRVKGKDQNGGGVYVNANGFTITNCVLDSCGAYNGGGLYWANKTVGGGVLKCVFTNCVSDNDGAGLYLYPAKGFVRGTTFADCAAVNNAACCINGAGGVIVDGVFTNCTGNYGGAIRGVSGSSSCAVTNTSFVSCGANAGPAIYSDAGATLFGCRIVGSRDPKNNNNGPVNLRKASVVDTCCFSRNQGKEGVTVALAAGSVMKNCIVEDQQRSVGDAGTGVVRYSTGTGRVTVRDSKFLSVAGGSMADGNVDFENCVFSNATVGFAFVRDRNHQNCIRDCLFTDCPEPVKLAYGRYENCSFVGNVGGATVSMWNSDKTSPVLSNCVFWANTPYTADTSWHGSMGLLVKADDFDATNRVKMANCVFQSAQETDARAPDIRDADKTGASTALTKKVVRKGPKFVDPANGDWHLRQNSPLRDAALTLGWMTEGAADLDGKPRRISSDGKAYPDSLPDIGCYECDIPKPGLLLQVR